MKAALSQFQAGFEGDLFFDELHTMLYATDASVYRKKPLAVAYPKNTKGLRQLIAFASEHQTSLIPRTAGTSLAGQCVGDGIVVDVSRYFTEILHIDLENRTVTLQPGVIRDELNAVLEPHGLFFGPNTSTSNRCMIGGMVGNNSSGTTSIQYGVTRDKVVEMEVLLSNGETCTFGPLNAKAFHAKRKGDTLEAQLYHTVWENLKDPLVRQEIRDAFPKPEIHRRNMGYAVDILLDTTVFDTDDTPFNMCSLLCGSEGTLAFTTSITLRLDPLPPKQAVVIAAHYDSIAGALRDVSPAMQHQLYACELMDEVILNCTKNNKTYQPYRFFIEGAPKAILLFELRADTAELLERQKLSLMETLQREGNNYATPALEGAEITMVLELRKAGLGLLGNMTGDDKAVACIEDTAVALEDLPTFISEFTALMEGYGQQAVYYAHAGAGELHLRPILNLKDTEDVKFFRRITTEVAHLTKRYRGSFSGEHGDGIVRGEFLPLMIGEKQYELLKRIKTAFDPRGIFNPGKIVNPVSMDASLRYEPGRAEPEIKTLMDFSDSQGLLRLAEKCNGSGDCRKTEHAHGAMCPSYHATRKEKDTTRARANVLREVLTKGPVHHQFASEALKEAFELCLSCKACASECPSNVDMAIAKAEFQYQYRKETGTSRSDRFLGKSSYYTQWAARYPKLANGILKQSFLSKWTKAYLGIARKRSFPEYATKSLSKRIKHATNQLISNWDVVLYIDEFSNFIDADIAEDAYELLRGLGYRVRLVTQLDSARALISKGFLEEAKKVVNENIAYLKGHISENTPLIGIEPSAILGFRDEFLRLAEDTESAGNIAKHTYLVEEFLASEIRRGRITSEQFTTQKKQIKIHVHCHQKALSDQKSTFDILNLPKHFTPTIIPSGCCGMAGSFGFEKDHYEISMKIGALKLFPAIQKTAPEVLIAANGTSCRHQILDGTGRKALHPATILREALL